MTGSAGEAYNAAQTTLGKGGKGDEKGMKGDDRKGK